MPPLFKDPKVLKYFYKTAFKNWIFINKTFLLASLTLLIRDEREQIK